MTQTNSSDQIFDWSDRISVALSSLDDWAEKASHASRLFQGRDVLALTGIRSSSTLHKYQKEKEDFPQPVEIDGKSAGYTINQIHQIQDILGTRPGRKNNDQAKYIASANLKGGCQKSSSCLGLGYYAAYLGYRVLFVDIDPQGSLTFHLGFNPDHDIHYADTAGPYLRGDATVEYTDENGETYERATKPLSDIVKKNIGPGVNLTPASLHLTQVESSLTSAIVRAADSGDYNQAQSLYNRLRLAMSEVEDDYDLIIIDGTPSLGALTLNLLTATDFCLVPVPTEVPDFASTGTFLGLFGEYIDSYEEIFKTEMPIPNMMFLATKFGGNASQTKTSRMIHSALQDIFEDNLIKAAMLKHDAAISLMQTHKCCPFTTDFYKLPTLEKVADKKRARQQQNKMIENMELIYADILERVTSSWPSKIQEREEKLEMGVIA